MMCPECGAFIDEEDVWCPECDTFLDDEWDDDTYLSNAEDEDYGY